MDNKQKVDIDYTNQAVPASARKSFGAMFVIMLGFTFFPQVCGPAWIWPTAWI